MRSTPGMLRDSDIATADEQSWRLVGSNGFVTEYEVTVRYSTELQRYYGTTVQWYNGTTVQQYNSYRSQQKHHYQHALRVLGGVPKKSEK